MRLKINNNLAVVSPTNDWAAFVLGIFFVVIGVLAAVVLYQPNSTHERWLADCIPFLAIVAGMGLSYFVLRPRKFDKTLGYFWSGFGTATQKNSTKIDDIESLALYSPDADSSSWTLRARLVSSKEHHIAYSSNTKAIQKNTQRLAEFLSVPYEIK